MKKHTKIYYEAFDLAPEDFVAFEMCTAKAVDIHHINPKGMGGSKNKDIIENLIALCRKCHERAHKIQKPYYSKGQLTLQHKRMLIYYDVKHDKNLMYVN